MFKYLIYVLYSIVVISVLNIFAPLSVFESTSLILLLLISSVSGHMFVEQNKRN
jgi:hypothetical protein